MGCRVEELIREEVPSLGEDATVREATLLMASLSVGSCVVTRDGQAVGLFTERDLLTRVVAAGLDPAVVRVGEVCSRNLVVVGHDRSCREAVMKMQAHRCRRLFVYRGRQFLGLVKLTDLAYAMASRGPQMNMLVNVLGAVTFAVAIGVIAMLLLQLPEVIHFTGPIGGP